MVKILFMVTNHPKMGNLDKPTGWYLPEVAHPYHVFKEAGYDQTVASPKGGNAPMDPSSYDAFKGDSICADYLKSIKVTDSNGERIKDAYLGLVDTTPLASVNPADYDVVFCAGGHGPMFDFPNCELLHKAVRAVYEKGGIASAVCHGPAGIVDVKLSNGDYLVKDKEVTCFTNAEEEEMNLVKPMPFLLETRLREHGAKFCNSDNWQACVAASNRVVTGQNPASATPMAEKIVELLK